MRVFLSVLLSVLWATLAFAQDRITTERITNYDVDIEVERSGDVIITETIDLISLGQEIQRGIFRELPARYDFMGVDLPYDYELLSVTRDGQTEPVDISREGNGITWRIGDPNRYLQDGPHHYTIRYRMADQIRHQRTEDDPAIQVDRDELYHSAIGTYWNFPIDQAKATIRFPDGADIGETYVYTGRRGSRDSNAVTDIIGSTVTFRTTRPLNRREGMTVSASIEPGTIDPMSDARRREIEWIRNGAKVLLGGGMLGIALYYLMLWTRVGRDPQKPPVFARYAPPEDKSGRPYSPAALHYINRKGFKGMDALSSMLMQLGAQGALDIEADKKRTTIRRLSASVSHPDSVRLLDDLMAGRGGELVLKGKTDSKFYKGVTAFHRYIAKTYGRKYRRGNAGWIALGFFLSIVLAIIVLASPVSKSGGLIIGLFVGLALMNIVFAWLLPAPTKYGAEVKSAIDGFKLYLETAEEDRINTANPLGDRPPLMSVELYERFLPYAMALGVEKPWTKQFETSMPREAKNYQPHYARGSAFKSGKSLSAFNKSVAAVMTAGVAAAAPVSQSSSGGGFSSGGGGFSGGGGGGGGGGGW